MFLSVSASVACATRSPDLLRAAAVTSEALRCGEAPRWVRVVYGFAVDIAQRVTGEHGVKADKAVKICVAGKAKAE